MVKVYFLLNNYIFGSNLAEIAHPDLARPESGGSATKPG